MADAPLIEPFPDDELEALWRDVEESPTIIGYSIAQRLKATLALYRRERDEALRDRDEARDYLEQILYRASEALRDVPK